MLDRDGYPPGVPCWVDTAQPDPDAAVAFYGGLFGWEFADRMPPDAPGHYFVASLDGLDVAAVGSAPDGTPTTPAWNMYISVENADATAAKVVDAGGQVLAEPFDVLDAGRMAVCTDPSGAVFSIWQARGHRGAQSVNAPGTWNFSDLNTRDPDGAEAFYGAVFGWEATPFEGGGPTMWRMPGYGDFLELRDPDVRSRQDDVGAPPGFEDAIAWLMPMTSDQFPDDVAPHWTVTFAVDDTDAVVARASELGGNVLVPPFDAPFVRSAVISDPQGAVLTVSKFVPPT
ncbi:MAG: VOC family protein [Acidimicrobiia bacterium]